MTIAERPASVGLQPLVDPLDQGGCGKPIALWDGSRIVFEYKGIYLQIPGNQVVIRCHRNVWRDGAWRVCGHMAHLFSPVT